LIESLLKLNIKLVGVPLKTVIKKFYIDFHTVNIIYIIKDFSPMFYL